MLLLTRICEAPLTYGESKLPRFGFLHLELSRATERALGVREGGARGKHELRLAPYFSCWL